MLNFPSIQTWLTHRVSAYVSAKLHAKVEVGKVDFEFLKKLVLKDIYVEDLHHDTVLYAKSLKLDIGALDFDKHTLLADDLILDDTRLHFITYKGTHEINFQFILDALASKDTTPSNPNKPKWQVSLKNLTLNHVDLRLESQNDTSTYNGIKFSDMRVHNINLKASDVEFEGDTLRADMENLSAKEESGFTLQHMGCYVKLSSKKMELDALTIQTPKTFLYTDLIFKYSRFPDFFDFVNKVDMYAKFHDSRLCFDDVAYFADGLKGVHNTFLLSGEYSGMVNDLKGRNMDIAWGKDSRLQGDAHLKGLPDIDRTYMDIDIHRLVTTKSDIESLPNPPFDKESHLKLPDNIVYLGKVDFKGSFDGYISQFKTNGTLSTAIGDISAVLAMREDTVHKTTYYKGSLNTRSFNLGTFWQNSSLGNITSSVTIEGKGLTRNNADAQITGAVQSFSFKKYNYSNLALSGELKKGFFSGLLEVEDSNLQMDFNGNIDIASDIHSYHFNTYITKADLVKLNLVKDSVGKQVLSTHIEANIKGNNLDQMDGYIHMDSTKFAYHKNQYHLKYLDLNSTHKGENHLLGIRSDYADAKLSGYFPLTHASDCVENLLSAYIPNVFSSAKHERFQQMDKTFKGHHDYSLEVRFNENTGLTDLFIPTFKIANGTEIKISYKESGNMISVSGNSPQVEWTGKRMKHWSIEGTGNTSHLDIKTDCDTLFLADSVYAAAFNLKGSISRDTAQYTLKWSNDSANYADIPGFIAFPAKGQIDARLLNPIISLGDSAWQVNKQNMVTVDTSGIVARNLEFYHELQSILIQGKLSRQKNDAMLVTLKKINLKDLALITSIDIAGMVDGTVSVANVYNKHPFFAGSMNFEGLKFNKQYIGNGNLNSYWDNEAQAIAVNGQLMGHDTLILSFMGDYYDRDSNNLSLDLTLRQVPLKIVQPYIKDYCSEVEGWLSGNTHIGGNLNKPVMKGNVVAVVKKVKIDYLNTYYHSPGLNVAISPDTFLVQPSPLLDERQDSATVSGVVSHDHFKNFYMDFNMNAHNFLCLHTTEAMNSLYYGTGFATGGVHIYGTLDFINIDANITTDKGTQFNIPLSNPSEVNQGDYIRFISSKDQGVKKQPGYKVKTGGLQMSFTVHVTPDATTNLIFAQKVGDVMTGRGRGTIQLNMNTQGEFDIRGNYTVTDGTYLFTLRNTLSKAFRIREGGTINWSGDPYNADIDITASYSTKRTSLAPLSSLFPEDSSVVKKSYPYSVDMNLKGKLQSPAISFNVDLPTVDASTSQIVENFLKSNPDEMDRQVFALLILNSFLPPQDRPGSGASTSAGVAAGLNSTEFLSDELNSMLQGISKKFNVGFTYQPGTAVSGQELQVMFSTQLFNDRVSINSDVGTIGNTSTGAANENTNNIVGEVNVEYSVNKNGKLKLKAFNKANDNSVINLSNAPYTQGAGVTYRESFNTLGELWARIKKKFKHNSKKEQNSSASNN